MKRVGMLALVIALLCSSIHLGIFTGVAEASGTSIATHYPQADVMSIEGSVGYDGVYNNDFAQRLYVGMTNEAPDFLNTRNKSAFRFKLDADKEVVAASLELYVEYVDGNPGYPLYLDVYGSPNNDLPNADGPLNAFPVIDAGASPVRYVAPTDLSGTPVVPPGGKITVNVTDIVKAYTDYSDRDITLVAVGNESSPLNGRFFIYSAEFASVSVRPKLTVTYSDNEPPIGTLSVREGMHTNSSVVTLDISASDPDAGDTVTAMRFTENLSNWPSVWENYASTNSFQLSAGDGPKTVYMQLKDNRDGISSVYSTSVYLDTSAPTGTISINSGAAFTGSRNVNLALSADDTGSGLSHMRLRNEDQPAGSGSWELYAASKSWTLSSGDGAKTVYVEFRDAAGNVSAGTINDSITLDTTPPQVTGVVNGGLYNSAVTINFNEGFATLNGANVAAAPFTVTDEGSYTVVVTDVVGNTTTLSFEIDLTAPNGTITINNGNPWSNNVNVSLTLSGLSSDTREIQISNNPASFDDHSGWLPISATVAWSLAPGDGVKTVYARFKDQAGNISAIVSDSITLLTTAPTGTVKINIGAEWSTGTSVQLSFEDLSDHIAEFQVSNLNGDWSAVGWKGIQPTDNWNLTAGDGDKTVYVRFKDEAGNIGSAVSASIKLDTTAPTGTISINDGEQWTNSLDVTLTLTMDDGIEGSGASKMRFSNDGTSWSGWEPAASRANWALLAGDGDKTVFVQFKDAAGNIGTGNIQAAIKLDQTKPTGGIQINNGAQSTQTRAVALTLSSSDGIGSGVVEMRFSEDGVVWSVWESFSGTKNWNLTGGSGTKNVHAEFRDAAGNISDPAIAAIEYRDNSGSGAGGSTGPIRSTSGSLILPVGSAGEVSLDQEIFITVPANAISKTLEINIEKVSNTNNLIVHNEVLASSVFHVQKNLPENLNKKAALTMVFNPTKVSSNETVAIFYYDEDAKAWVKIDGGKIVGDRISAEVYNFMSFAVLVVDQASGMPITSPSIDEPNENNLSDIAGHWAESTIKEAVKRGVASGYPNGIFKPDATITRAEFVMMLMNALKPASEVSALNFTDTAEIPAWSRQAVAYAVEAEIVSGYNDGSFRPFAEIARMEMAVLIAKAYGADMATVTMTGFSDDSEIPEWAKGAVLVMKQLGIVEGRGGNRFVPNETATRAEAVTMIMNLLNVKSTK